MCAIANRAALMQPLQYDLQAASLQQHLWRSHSNAISKHQVAEAKRITLARQKLLLAKTGSKTGSRCQS